MRQVLFQADRPSNHYPDGIACVVCPKVGMILRCTINAISWGDDSINGPARPSQCRVGNPGTTESVYDNIRFDKAASAAGLLVQQRAWLPLRCIDTFFPSRFEKIYVSTACWMSEHLTCPMMPLLRKQWLQTPSLGFALLIELKKPCLHDACIIQA
jgi:hypothetical protein